MRSVFSSSRILVTSSSLAAAAGLAMRLGVGAGTSETLTFAAARLGLQSAQHDGRSVVGGRLPTVGGGRDTR